VREHVFVCEQLYGPRPMGAHSHHKNANSLDQHPDNLEWKDGGKHLSDHLSERNRSGLAGWKVTGRHPRGMAGKRHKFESFHNEDTQRKLSIAGSKPKRLRVNHTVLSSAEYVGDLPVYDMTVADAHSFIANGMVVHNSGKSIAIVETILWALYDRMARHRDRIAGQKAVNKRTGADVTVGIETGAGERRVHRARGVRGGPRFEITTVDGVQVPVSKDPSRRADDVAEMLGFDYAAFRTAVVVSGEYSLARSGFAQQMAVLEALLNLDELGGGSVLAAKDANALEKDLAAWQVEVRLRTQAHEDAVAQLQQLQAANAVDYAAETQRLKEELTQAEWAQSMLHGLQLVCADSRRSQEYAAREARTMFATRQTLLQKQHELVTRAQRVDTACPTCLRPYANAEELEEARARAEQDAALLQVQVAEAGYKHRVAEQRYVTADNKLRAQEEELSTRRGQAGQQPRILEQLTQMEQQQAQHAQRMDQARTRVESALSALEQARTENAGVSRVHWRKTFWVSHFGRDGMQADFFQSAVPVLNHAAKKYTQALTNGKMRVEFNPLRENRTDDLIRLWMGDEEVTYDDVSKGEKARVDVTVALAMRDLARVRLRQPVNVAIYDEVFDPVDDAGMRAVAKLLAEEAARGVTVFVVTHSTTLKSLFPGARVLHVVRQNDEATVTYVA
jgi:DNA repair exonuclease SbcCD ATPase subunit